MHADVPEAALPPCAAPGVVAELGVRVHRYPSRGTVWRSCLKECLVDPRFSRGYPPSSRFNGVLPRTGRAGRPRLVPTAGLLLGQVIKHHAGRCLVGITRRVVRGTAEAITAVLAATGTGT